MVVALEGYLVVMAGLVCGCLAKHVDNRVAVAVPELIAQRVEELNDSVGFLGGPVWV